MLRTTKHSLSIANNKKRHDLSKVLYRAKIFYSMCIEYLWKTHIKYTNGEFSIRNDLLNLPLYHDHNVIKYNPLSCTLKNMIFYQALGAIGSAVENRRRMLWSLTQAKDAEHSARLSAKLKKLKVVKPNIPDNFSIEISSGCGTFVKSESRAIFGFLRLGPLGSKFKPIYLPIQNYKYLDTYSKDEEWVMKKSFLITADTVIIRWEKKSHPKSDGITVGGDTGFKTVLTFSDGQATPHHDKDGHSLESICRKMLRKKKGSKAFKACQEHRENFIHWSINQLDLDHIKEVKLEEVVNIFHGKKTSRLMRSWTNSIIEEKIRQKLELKDVSLSFNKSPYRSQRCSNCSLVLKSNRKGKVYRCKSCKIELDSDLNGANNNSIDLPQIPWWLFNSGKNKSGFLWKVDGFFEPDGRELRVPGVPKDNMI